MSAGILMRPILVDKTLAVKPVFDNDVLDRNRFSFFLEPIQIRFDIDLPKYGVRR